MDQKALDRFLASLRYPVHYLDFETVMPAVPLFSGTRPYEQIPFQFSCHVVRRPGDEPEHARFLARNADDPRPAFARRLMEAVGEEGSVVVYNAPFERGIIRTLGQAGLLEDDWTENVLDRTVDLLAPFRSFAVYHPDQGGSVSMKNVLPALTGRGYDDLAIAEGQTASAEYFRVTYGDVSDEERDSVYRQLTDYCAQDTLGMMHIVDRLTELAGRRRP